MPTHYDSHLDTVLRAVLPFPFAHTCLKHFTCPVYSRFVTSPNATYPVLVLRSNFVAAVFIFARFLWLRSAFSPTCITLVLTDKPSVPVVLVYFTTAPTVITFPIHYHYRLKGKFAACSRRATITLYSWFPTAFSSSSLPPFFILHSPPFDVHHFLWMTTGWLLPVLVLLPP